MKKPLLLFAACLSLSVQAQTVILEESLKDRFEESYTVISTVPSELEGWEFANCYGQKEPLEDPRDNIFVQVGSSSNTGSVTTRNLVGLSGNALVSANICPIEVFTLNIEPLVNGSITQTVNFNTTNKWYRTLPILLRNGNSDTQLRFSPTESGKKRFLIANISVTDIDDAIFYESFNKCDGKGGNDGNFEHQTSNTVVKASPQKIDNYNYLNQDEATVTIAKECVYFFTNSTFTLAPFELQTNNCVLTFNAAAIDNYSNVDITIEYTDKSTNRKKTIACNPSPARWNTYSYALVNIDPSKSVTFSGSFFYLDEVKVVEIKELGIDESATNVSSITSKVGKYVDAQLIRTFKKDIWNTCCLPFTVKASYFKEVAGDDLKITMLKLHDITADGVFNFEDADEVAAGEPFLLQVNKDIENPLFTRMKITTDAGATKTDASATGYAFKGILCKTALKTDHTDVFLGTDELLHYPTTSGNTMKGMRAYFTIPAGANLASARISIVDSTEGINEQPVVQQNRPSRYYNLNGQLLEHPNKGFYIIRSANGQQVKKIIVK